MMNTPVPAHGQGAAPTAPPGPLAVSDLFSGTFRTYGRAFGLFVGLLLVPILIALAAFLVAGVLIAIMAVAVFSGGSPSTGAVAGFAVAVGLIVAVTLLVVIVFSYVFQGRTYVAAIDLATGRTLPSWSNLKARTEGLFGRVVKLGLIMVGVGLAFYLVIALLMVAILVPLSGRNGNAGAPSPFLFLLGVVFYGVLVWVAIKLLYTLVAMAEENLGAIDSLKRSWAMTNGAFWRTLGKYLIMAFLLFVASSLISALPVIATGSSTNPTAGQTAAGLVLGLVTFVASVLLGPLQLIWTALMYLGRHREIAGIPYGGGAPAGGPSVYGPAVQPGIAPYPGASVYPPPPAYGQDAPGSQAPFSQHAHGQPGQPSAQPYGYDAPSAAQDQHDPHQPYPHEPGAGPHDPNSPQPRP